MRRSARMRGRILPRLTLTGSALAVYCGKYVGNRRYDSSHFEWSRLRDVFGYSTNQELVRWTRNNRDLT